MFWIYIEDSSYTNSRNWVVILVVVRKLENLRSSFYVVGFNTVGNRVVYYRLDLVEVSTECQNWVLKDFLVLRNRQWYVINLDNVLNTVVHAGNYRNLKGRFLKYFFTYCSSVPVLVNSVKNLGISVVLRNCVVVNPRSWGTHLRSFCIYKVVVIKGNVIYDNYAFCSSRVLNSRSHLNLNILVSLYCNLGNWICTVLFWRIRMFFFNSVLYIKDDVVIECSLRKVFKNFTVICYTRNCILIYWKWVVKCLGNINSWIFCPWSIFLNHWSVFYFTNSYLFLIYIFLIDSV